MSFREIFIVFSPIIILVLLGFIFSFFKKITAKTLADLIIYVTAPAMIFCLISKHSLEFGNYLFVFSSAFLLIPLTGSLSYLVLKLLRIKVEKSFYLPVMFMNSAFIGYPLALFTLGEKGLSYAIFYDLANVILIFTLGIFIISRSKNLVQVFKIPIIYAVILGFIFNFFNLEVPAPLFNSLKLIGDTTIPLALFLLGYRLRLFQISSLSYGLLNSLFRIGGGFMLAYIYVGFFNAPPLLKKVIILISSLPSAITAIVLAEEYETDVNYISSTIAISTILGLFILPFLIKFIL